MFFPGSQTHIGIRVFKNLSSIVKLLEQCKLIYGINPINIRCDVFSVCVLMAFQIHVPPPIITTFVSLCDYSHNNV